MEEKNIVRIERRNYNDNPLAKQSKNYLFASGRKTLKVVPSPSWLRTVILPLCAATISCTIASPNRRHVSPHQVGTGQLDRNARRCAVSHQGDTRSTIGNADFHLGLIRQCLQSHLTAQRHVPERIVNQIGENLRQPCHHLQPWLEDRAAHPAPGRSHFFALAS